jgi:hypothetical protein
MNNFKNINCKINFVDGVFINIYDSWNTEYLVEVYENFGNDWALSSHSFLNCGHWYKFIGKKFRNPWRVKIWGWENEQPVLVAEETYDEMDKNVALTFDTDSYSEARIWTELAIKYRDKFRTNLNIISKFSGRLTNEYKDSKITFFDKSFTVEYDSDKYYSHFKIGRYNIKRDSLGEWGSGWRFCSNHTKPNISSEHRADWISFDSTELFNNIMNL